MVARRTDKGLFYLWGATTRRATVPQFDPVILRRSRRIRSFVLSDETRPAQLAGPTLKMCHWHIFHVAAFADAQDDGRGTLRMTQETLNLG